MTINQCQSWLIIAKMVANQFFKSHKRGIMMFFAENIIRGMQSQKKRDLRSIRGNEMVTAMGYLNIYDTKLPRFTMDLPIISHPIISHHFPSDLVNHGQFWLQMRTPWNRMFAHFSDDGRTGPVALHL